MAAAIPLPTAQVAIWEYEDNGNWLLMKEEYAYIFYSTACGMKQIQAY